MSPSDQAPPLEVTIGLEIHVQLNTRTKLFCDCPVVIGAAPNGAICATCAGLPGALPVLNDGAVSRALALALALGCEILSPSLFSRKHYTYGDLPKGYQITQYDTPFARGGTLKTDEGLVRLERIHLEEDAGKLLHDLSPGESLIDLNRAGTPLLEVVTEPCLRSPEGAEAFGRRLHQLVCCLGISDGDMSQGSLRIDGNISLGRKGGPKGAKVEIKNLNSFKFLRQALSYEVGRQSRAIEGGETIGAETRGFDPSKGETTPQRDKEGAGAYRYMIEPDLGALVLSSTEIDAARAALPELPWEKEGRLMSQYGLKADVAADLVRAPGLAPFFEASSLGVEDGGAIAKLLMGPLVGRLKAMDLGIHESPIEPEALGLLGRWVAAGTLTPGGAKTAMDALITQGGSPEEIVDALGLRPITDERTLEPMVREVLAAHPGEVEAYRGGKTRLLGYLMGRVMGVSKGRAAPKVAKAILLRHLEGEA